MTLRLLEESTLWTNRSELYIGLFKEVIQKNTREANIPLVFFIILLSDELPSRILQQKTYSNSRARIHTWPPLRSRVEF